MVLCTECKQPIKSCMGDGYCKKHGVFPFYSMQLKEKCSACAKEKNICQVCGNSLSKENK